MPWSRRRTALIEAKGATSLSLGARGQARRHDGRCRLPSFADKEALLAVVAARGFMALNTRSREMPVAHGYATLRLEGQLSRLPPEPRAVLADLVPQAS